MLMFRRVLQTQSTSLAVHECTNFTCFVRDDDCELLHTHLMIGAFNVQRVLNSTLAHPSACIFKASCSRESATTGWQFVPKTRFPGSCQNLWQPEPPEMAIFITDTQNMYRKCSFRGGAGCQRFWELPETYVFGNNCQPRNHTFERIVMPTQRCDR